MSHTPDLIFAHRGLGVHGDTMQALARAVSGDRIAHRVPKPGAVTTWQRYARLLEQSRGELAELFAEQAGFVGVIAYGLGGLVCLDILATEPAWWRQLAPLVLIATPLAGVPLAAQRYPEAIEQELSATLRRDRRDLLEPLARAVPVLAISSERYSGNDGDISLESTQAAGIAWVQLAGVPQEKLPLHPQLIMRIQGFWNLPILPDLGELISERLAAIPGLQRAEPRDIGSAHSALHFIGDLLLHSWHNPAGYEFVMLSADDGAALFAGQTNWLHAGDLRRAVAELRQELAAYVVDG